MKPMDMDNVLQVVAMKAGEGNQAEGDYYGPDGLIHCGKCGSRKQREITKPSGGTMIVPVRCQCHMLEYRRWQEEQAAYEENTRIKKLPINEIQNAGVAGCTFAAAKENKALAEYCYFRKTCVNGNKSSAALSSPGWSGIRGKTAAVGT